MIYRTWLYNSYGKRYLLYDGSGGRIAMQAAVASVKTLSAVAGTGRVEVQSSERGSSLPEPYIVLGKDVISGLMSDAKPENDSRFRMRADIPPDEEELAWREFEKGLGAKT